LELRQFGARRALIDVDVEKVWLNRFRLSESVRSRKSEGNGQNGIEGGGFHGTNLAVFVEEPSKSVHQVWKNNQEQMVPENEMLEHL
jgi:hypothetical protein